MMSGVVAAVLLAGCGGSDFPAPAVMQGTTVTDAGLTMTVTNTSLQNRSPRIGRGGVYARRFWVIVKLHVSNSSDKPALFDPMFQLLFVGSSEHLPNPLVAEGLDDKTSSAASLSPGSEADVALAFEVSDAPAFGKYSLQLAIRGDLNSPGAMVNLTTS